MSRWILQGGTLLLGMVLTAGCASPPMAGVEKPERVEKAPVARQEARLHLPAEPDSLDSARTVHPAAFDLLGVLMEGLVRQGEGGEVLPGVAERWEAVDNRHFTFYLRRDARWSDGRQVTAEDFVYAWLRVLDPQQGSDYAFLLYEIEGAEAWNTLDPKGPEFGKQASERIRRVKMTAVDEHTLQVTLRAPNPNWANYTAHPVFFPQRATAVAREGRQYGGPGPLLSNGPFLLERWETGREILLRKNPAYWNAASIRLQRLRFRIERDGKAALRLFELGELDLAVLPGELAAAERGVQSMTQPSTMGLVFNTAHPYLSRQDVRQALHLAINRKRLVAEAVPWNALPSEGLIPPSLGGGWNPRMHPIAPQGNPLQARQLWERVCNELKIKGMTIELLHAEESTEIARAVGLMLEEILPGLQVKLEAVPFTKRLERVRQGNFELALQGWAADHDDPLTLLSLFVTDGPGNDARWINPEYDTLIAEAFRGNKMSRAEAMAAAEQVLLSQLPVVPLYHPVRHWITKSNFKGLQYAPLGARLDLRGAYFDR